MAADAATRLREILKEIGGRHARSFVTNFPATKVFARIANMQPEEFARTVIAFGLERLFRESFGSHSLQEAARSIRLATALPISEFNRKLNQYSSIDEWLVAAFTSTGGRGLHRLQEDIRQGSLSRNPNAPARITGKTGRLSAESHGISQLKKDFTGYSLDWAVNVGRKTEKMFHIAKWLLSNGIPAALLEKALENGTFAKLAYSAAVFRQNGFDVGRESNHVLRHAERIDARAGALLNALEVNDGAVQTKPNAPGTSKLRREMSRWQKLAPGVRSKTRYEAFKHAGNMNAAAVNRFHDCTALSDLPSILDSLSQMRAAKASLDSLAAYGRISFPDFMRAHKLVRTRAATHEELAEKYARTRSMQTVLKEYAPLPVSLPTTAGKPLQQEQFNFNTLLKEIGFARHPALTEIKAALSQLSTTYSYAQVKKAAEAFLTYCRRTTSGKPEVLATSRAVEFRGLLEGFGQQPLSRVSARQMEVRRNVAETLHPIIVSRRA